MKTGVISIGMILFLTVFGVTTFSSVGSSNLKTQDKFTLEEMLTYSMEDELLAKEEYRMIIEKFQTTRPFTNIIEAEKKHIRFLEPLLEKYEVDYPKITKEDLVVPKTLLETYEIGVQAEISNIAMYNRFLEEELPLDVKETFTRLRDASKNHLRAFERQVAKR